MPFYSTATRRPSTTRSLVSVHLSSRGTYFFLSFLILTYRRLSMLKFFSSLPRFPYGLFMTATVLVVSGSSFHACFAGEPAADFLKRLRAAEYFDTAITYLDRLDQYAGVEPTMLDAIALEKAQTFIDAAGATRNAENRDELLLNAETALTDFLKQSSHPRVPEARMQLGRLQMVRGLQLMATKPDEAKRSTARDSFMAAAGTFDLIVNQLRETLKDMQGAKIDADQNPEQAALRDQYRGEYLQAMSSSGDARYEAAMTHADPGKDGKSLLEESLATYMDLSEKYDSYVQGALAMVQRAKVQKTLGMTEQALDSYMRMLEQPEAEPLRLAKFEAGAGMIDLMLSEDPPRYQSAIDRGEQLSEGARPNERNLPALQGLRLELAKAYLAKSKDSEKQKPADAKRAESDGRQLLIRVSKVPGEFAEKANAMLSDMGINLSEVADLPTAEDPESLVSALDDARELLSVLDQLEQSIELLKGQASPSQETKDQIAQNEKQLADSRSLAIQILRRGLSLVSIDSDNEMVNQARQMLAYLLYQQKQYRDASVVGLFLALNAPSSDAGLRGGLVALNALQLQLSEDPENQLALSRLEQLGAFLTKTWPDEPDAAAAQGVLIKLALRADRWEDAGGLIAAMPAGGEKASFQRLMGQLLWNKSIQTRQDGDEEAAGRYLDDAANELQEGLAGVTAGLADGEAMKAALVLAKVALKQGRIQVAYDTLENETYGPIPLVERQGAPDASFSADLYSVQLQVLVQRMTAEGEDTTALLNKATAVMEKLRESIQGPNSQQELTRIFILMARDIRDQLQGAGPAQKAKLIDAFRVFLDRITGTTKDVATLQWVGQTLMDLAEASMTASGQQAKAQSKSLLESASATFKSLKEQEGGDTLVVRFQEGKALRLLGEYSESLKVFESLLKEKASMLDAQVEAALAYEQWAATAPPAVQSRVYQAALAGARPDANKKNVIWGWGKISQETSRNPRFKERFFDARYHVALCRFLAGKAEGNAANKKLLIEKSVTDITRVAALYPDLGGVSQKKKFDALLKLIQKELGQPQVGLATK